MVNLVHFKEEKKMSNLITFHEDFNLTFGVEVEVTTTNITREELSSYLKEKNVEVTSTRSYTHEITKGYKVVTDSTVSGFEVVSPILKGEEGLKSMERMVDALKEHPNVSVDRHCGVHVHFGISEKDENGNWKESLPLEKIKNVLTDDYYDILNEKYVVSNSSREFWVDFKQGDETQGTWSDDDAIEYTCACLSGASDCVKLGWDDSWWNPLDYWGEAWYGYTPPFHQSVEEVRITVRGGQCDDLPLWSETYMGLKDNNGNWNKFLLNP